MGEEVLTAGDGGLGCDAMVSSRWIQVFGRDWLYILQSLGSGVTAIWSTALVNTGISSQLLRMEVTCSHQRLKVKQD